MTTASTAGIVRNHPFLKLPTLAPDADTLVRTASFALNADGTLKGTVTEARSGEAARRYRGVCSGISPVPLLTQIARRILAR
jgi:hypothetical protein